MVAGVGGGPIADAVRSVQQDGGRVEGGGPIANAVRSVQQDNLAHTVQQCVQLRLTGPTYSTHQSRILHRTECSGKTVFFHNLLQPLPRLHRCKRPLKPSMQCECTVTPNGW